MGEGLHALNRFRSGDDLRSYPFCFKGTFYQAIEISGYNDLDIPLLN